MCGIFFLTQTAENNSTESIEKIKSAFYSGKGRGPDNDVFYENYYVNSKYHYPINNNWIYQQYFHLGFHRLSINGLDEISNQPIIIDNVALICNGEIYNYKELYAEHDIVPQTNSDCEAILQLYLKYGTEKMLQLIHGVFAFVIIDDRNMVPKEELVRSFSKNIDDNDSDSDDKEDVQDYYVNDDYLIYDRKVVIARDAYGIRPMFILKKSDGSVGVASLLKQLHPFCETNFDNIRQFKPGTYNSFFFHRGLKIQELGERDFKNKLLTTRSLQINNDTIWGACFNVNKYLNEAVKMRVDNTDRPVACLLSGGLDSSLITALVAKYVPDPKQLNTFSIGMSGASDLNYARIVANHLGTNHHEIIVSEEDFFGAIPNVIKAIESYDTTTVRASVGNYLIGKYISENCDAKVIFNGDGSDELFGGYLYMHCAPDSEAFDIETKRLLDQIHFFDVLRSDRCISCHGLEPRTPFMDVNLIAYYLSLKPNLRNHRSVKKLPEKYILRKAFASDNLLPDEVLWRTKEAFSDGVSNEDNSWHTIIKRRLEEHASTIKNSPYYAETLSLEQNYYKQIFNDLYPNSNGIIPQYWMPKFIEASDCSARSLGIYKELH